ncbi:hypothetical protein Vadar_021467 [Vaccinium darrowii]|uniref:Uncharacterized protein n=1 Tax=Vaccinium darrowii TaxID=229202 RepID=A0ACB7YG91_9ERIC|nr:hypothetical protein Vadar_021467 [Vaccinium darrowii]
MKTVSCPNLNRETTYFPSFFTSLDQPDHEDTTLEERPKIDHSADTEASETSPCKHIILPFNEIGLLAAPSSIVMFGPGSEQKDQTLQSPSSVGSNQFSGDFYLDFPEYEFRHNPAAPTNAVVHVGLVGTTTTSSLPLPPSRCKTLGGHRASNKKPRLTPGNRDFFPKTHECSICGLEFPIGQALGGHMRRHRPKVAEAEIDEANGVFFPLPKTHECSICGLEFAIGQALGGHMRRHRPAGGHMRRYRPVVAAAVSGHEKAVGSEKRDTSLDLNWPTIFLL